MDSSIQGTVMRNLITHFSSDNLIGKKIKNGELRKQLVKLEPKWRCPEGMHATVIDMDHFHMEFLEAEEPNSEYAILQLHGGGYVSGLRNAYRTFAAVYLESCDNISVLTPDYRVAPEHIFPSALEDAFRSYEWLLEKGFKEEKIIVCGDSAGGGLALSLCMLLKQRQKKLPGGIIVMSPWTDLTQSGESYVMNFNNDPLFGKTKDSLIYNRDYIGENDPRNPYISPLYGNFNGFPPMLVQVGSYEMLLSDSVGITKKAQKAGVDVKLSIYEGMFHEFQMALSMIPESKKAWDEVINFVLQRMKKQE